MSNEYQNNNIIEDNMDMNIDMDIDTLSYITPEILSNELENPNLFNAALSYIEDMPYDDLKDLFHNIFVDMHNEEIIYNYDNIAEIVVNSANNKNWGSELLLDCASGMYGVEYDNLICNFLLESGILCPSIRRQRCSNYVGIYTKMCSAINNNRLDSMIIYLSIGYNPKISNDQGETLLEYIAQKNPEYKHNNDGESLVNMANLLIQNGAIISDRVLFKANEQNDKEIYEYYISLLPEQSRNRTFTNMIRSNDNVGFSR